MEPLKEDEMDWTTFIQIAAAIVLGVGGFLYRELKFKVDKTYEEFLAYKVHAAETFITIDQLTRIVENLNKAVANVNDAVLRIEQRLNNQMDNRNHSN